MSAPKNLYEYCKQNEEDVHKKEDIQGLLDSALYEDDWCICVFPNYPNGIRLPRAAAMKWFAEQGRDVKCLKRAAMVLTLTQDFEGPPDMLITPEPKKEA